MKCHPIVPFILGVTLFTAAPALARDHGPTLTIQASIHHLLPLPLPLPVPPVVVVRQPERRDVVVVDREHRHGHYKQDWRPSCDAHDRRRAEVRHRHDHARRPDWRHRPRTERVAVVNRGWERRDD